MSETKHSRDRIRELNDRMRTTFDPSLGRVIVTSGVDALSANDKAAAIAKVKAFSTFDRDNDPNGEHDFGSFEIAGEMFFWKIDYYDRSLEFGSEDPANPSKTMRVLTLMLAEEY
ncbi:MAG: hypothetical protein C5B44_05190 [Acidobacteria bacterium]|nr:MAG: hypothetical protein C5B44_05190 [Acidobacteriota bacterium]